MHHIVHVHTYIYGAYSVSARYGHTGSTSDKSELKWTYKMLAEHLNTCEHVIPNIPPILHVVDRPTLSITVRAPAC